MTVEETKLKDCFVITPNVFADERGYFFESFNARKFKELTNIAVNFVQDNESKSLKGVLRGLHFQTGEHEQSKLIRVISGAILDVCVDLRRSSKTFGQHFSITLSADNKKQLFVPKGFAHGFFVLKNDTVINYKCDHFYNKASERGIVYDDKELNIDWGLSENEIILSDKDKVLPTFLEYLNEN